MATGKPKDENIVIFYNGKYYDVPSTAWMTPAHLMGAETSQFAKKIVIEAGKEVGYVPDVLVGEQPGGYSAVLNLTAVLKNKG